MTGTGGWAYFSATRYILGVRPQLQHLEIDPCIPAEWDGFEVTREWRGAVYEIRVNNPKHVMKGVHIIRLDGDEVEVVPVQERGTTHMIEVELG